MSGSTSNGDRDLQNLRFDESGLVPAVIVNADTGAVLTLAYMNRESLDRTVASGQTWFWSRSRQELWNKGATSGNRQTVRSIAVDCDGDALLIAVDPAGPACHTGDVSCFAGTPLSGEQSTFTASYLDTLEQTLIRRRRDMPAGSYSAYLFNSGEDKILKKIGEEATELVIAAKGEGRERLISETADLLFHVTALLVNDDIALSEVMAELERRSR